MTAGATDSSTALPPGVDPDDVRILVEKFRRVPDWTRRLDWTMDWAWQRMRVPASVLWHMVGCGLPHEVRDGVPMLDRLDILNTAMHLDLGPFARAVRRSWPLALRTADEGRPLHYELRYQVRCTDPEPHDECRYEFQLVGGDRAERVIKPGEFAEIMVEISPETDWPALPQPAREALDVAAGLEFMLLSEDIRRDVGFLLSSGLADCAGVAIMLTDELLKRSVPARMSYGFVITPPYAVEHFWAEADVDGRWVPVDPVLIGAMVRWGVLDGAQWNPYRSLGPIVARVGDARVPPVTHNGTAVMPMLPTRLRQPTSEHGG